MTVSENSHSKDWLGRVGITLDELSTQSGHGRKSVLQALAELEERGLVYVQRAHRNGNRYTLLLTTATTVAGLIPAGHEPSNQSKWNHEDQGLVGVERTLTKAAIGVQKTPIIFPISGEKILIDEDTCLNSVQKPLMGTSDSVQKTLIVPPIEAIAAAAAISSSSKELSSVTDLDRSEIRRISDQFGVQIDGQDALKLKAGVEAAGLSLAHLRWFLRDERLSGARSPKAVLLSIARDFRIRSDGIEWPDSLDSLPPPTTRGLTREELLLL